MKILTIKLFAAAALFAGEKTDVLFYLQDAGETYALLPVVEKLEQKGISTIILAAGTAQEISEAAGVPYRRLEIERGWERGATLPDEKILAIVDEYEPKEVVAGVAYELQGQVLRAYREHGVPTFAYWDNFQPDGENAYFRTADKVQAEAEKLLVPCAGFKDDAVVVGQPSLEAWTRPVDAEAVRRKLGLHPGQKTALWIGGYGKEYEEAFCLLKEWDPEILLLVQPHPKARGEAIHLEPGMRLLKGEVSTKEAAAVSGLVLCHQSTAAFQALAAGKPVLHVIPEGQNFDSAPLRAGLAGRVSRAEDLREAVATHFGRPVEGFYELMGIPEKSAEVCANVLLETLKMKNLTHEKTGITLEKIREKVIQRGDLPHASVARQLELLEQLSQFDFGRFLIEHQGGLNGYWTYYMIERPKKPATPLEDFLINRSPVVLATRERAQIFKKAIQEEWGKGGVFASIPCGLMGDFLLLGEAPVSYVGIDIDAESIEGAKALAKEKGLSSNCSFKVQDAWQMEDREQYQLIASNGLNIYEKDEARVLQLYRKFYHALKPGGVLVTSFLTPPPGSNHRCEWKMDKLSLEDSLIQKIVMVDLLEARWLVFRTTDQTRSQLQQAGFQEIEFRPDAVGMFPTVIARKRA